MAESAKFINPYRMFNGAIVPNWLMGRKEINCAEKMVYARLGQYAGKKGVAFPYKGTLAREIGLNVDYVAVCLKKLVEVGLLHVTQRAAEGAPNLSNEYRFLDHSWIHELDEDEDEEGGGGSPHPPRGVSAPPSPLARTPLGGSPHPPTPLQKGRQSAESTGVSGGDFPLRESVEENQGRESMERGALAPLGTDRSPSADAPSSVRLSAEGNFEDTEEEQNTPTDELRADGGVFAPDGTVRRDRALASAAAQAAKTKAVVNERLARQATKRSLREKAKREQAEEHEREEETREGTALGRLEKLWTSTFREAFPETPAAKKWGGKQYGQMKQVLDLYDEDQVRIAVMYLLKNWKIIRDKLFKGQGDTTPGIGVLTYFHENLFPNSAAWVKHQQVLDEYEAFDPNDPYAERPSELAERCAVARRELKALGLL